MPEILQNTGVTLWSIRDDYDDLQTSVFEALTGTGGKSNIRLIDEAIGNINSKLNGYYFEYSDDRLYICKKSEDENIKKYPVTLDDNNGHIASKVDGSTITIDENGIVRGLSVDDALSSISTNPIQNKVVKAKVDEIEKNVSKNTEDIKKNVTNISNNTKNITSLETAVSSEKTRAESVENQLKTDLENGKKVWDDKYTKSEVDNKFSTLETNIDWKEAVSTYDDIATTYPTPDDGWTVNVKDTDYTYRYNGGKWVAISANAIPKATNEVDGLMTKEYARKLDGLTKYTPDGTTITADEDGTLHGVTKVTVDSDLSSTSTNPVQNKVVNAAIVKKADTISYDKSANILYLKSGSTVLSSVEIKSGGGATITPKPTVNPQIKNDDGKVIITWQDPTDTVIEGSTFSTWAGTKLVMKESGYPTSPDDGTLLVDNTTRDKYKTTGFTKTGLTNYKKYYFALFPYSTDGVYNYDSGNRLLGEPTDGLKFVTFAGGTDDEIAKMIQAHYNDQINIADYWAVGDTRTVHLSAMAATGVNESHREQDVQFVIGDFDHDDLATPINGHSKAAITLLQKDCLCDARNTVDPIYGGYNTENGYMDHSGIQDNWKECARRTWCNNVYFKALPTTWQSMIKTVNKKAAVGNYTSTMEIVQDKIFLAAGAEIFSPPNYSYSTEGTQYQYYKNATANRYKMPKWTVDTVSSKYWGRSPYGGPSSGFCKVDHDGSENFTSSDSDLGLAPCVCI